MKTYQNPPIGTPKYAVHHRRGEHSIDDFVVIGSGFRTLEEARAVRAVSGDLVVYMGSNLIVRDPAWLWDWEKKKNPNNYAHRAITWGNKLFDPVFVVP